MSMKTKHYATNMRIAFLVQKRTDVDKPIITDAHLYAYSMIGVLMEALTPEERARPANEGLVQVSLQGPNSSILLNPHVISEEMAKMCGVSDNFLHSADDEGELLGPPSRDTNYNDFPLEVPDNGYWVVEMELVRVAKVEAAENGEMTTTVEYLVDRERTLNPVAHANSRGVYIEPCDGVAGWKRVQRQIDRVMKNGDPSWMGSGMG